MRKLNMTGYLKADPEIKKSQSGKEYARLLTSYKAYKVNKEYEKEETTIWVRPIISNKLPEYIRLIKKLKKGDKIYVEGDLSVEISTDRNNEYKTSFTIYVDKLISITDTPLDKNPIKHIKPRESKLQKPTNNAFEHILTSMTKNSEEKAGRKQGFNIMEEFQKAALKVRKENEEWHEKERLRKEQIENDPNQKKSNFVEMFNKEMARRKAERQKQDTT